MRQLKGFLEHTAPDSLSYTSKDAVTNNGIESKKATSDEEEVDEDDGEKEDGDGENGFKLSQFTLVHVIIPLVFHHMTSEDFKKKDHIGLIQEAGALLGAICRHLTWSKYHNILRRILRLLQRNDMFREKRVRRKE